jgi:hypothetical protein
LFALLSALKIGDAHLQVLGGKPTGLLLIEGKLERAGLLESFDFNRLETDVGLREKLCSLVFMQLQQRVSFHHICA